MYTRMAAKSLLLNCLMSFYLATSQLRNFSCAFNSISQSSFTPANSKPRNTEQRLNTSKPGANCFC